MGVDAWRLLIDGAADGQWNMAVDRAVQLAHEAGEAPPTIRLYRWSRPTITLGRFQEADDLDWAAVERWGVDVVRRFTGGRGVLHDDELTYSIVAGTADGLPRGTAASYRHLCAGLVSAYSNLGVDAELTPRPRGQSGHAACYLHSTRADLSIGLAKLAGSAQTWTGATCLQHGSFTVSRDLPREAEVFGLDRSAVAALEEGTATLESLGVSARSESAVLEAVSRGIVSGLGIEAEPGELSRAERESAGLLALELIVARP